MEEEREWRRKGFSVVEIGNEKGGSFSLKCVCCELFPFFGSLSNPLFFIAKKELQLKKGWFG